MPGNIIKVNDWKQWYVGDSKMEELLDWLDKNGYKEKNVENEN